MGQTPAETSKGLAEVFSEIARQLYNSQSSVPPKVIFGNDEGFIIVTPARLRDDEDVPQMMCRIVHLIGRMRAWAHLCTIAETWIKRYEPEEAEQEEALNMKRGYLESISEIDPLVFTSISVMVIDLAEQAQSYFQSSTCHPKEGGGNDWEIEGYEGVMEGSMPERLLAAYAEAPDIPKELHGYPIPKVAEGLLSTGLAEHAMVMLRRDLI